MNGFLYNDPFLGHDFDHLFSFTHCLASVRSATLSSSLRSMIVFWLLTHIVERGSSEVRGVLPGCKYPHGLGHGNDVAQGCAVVDS